MKKKDIREFTRDQLILWFDKKGHKSYRAGQILKWLYLKNAESFDEMTDLSKNFRKFLSENFFLNRLVISKKQAASDGTTKYLFKLVDGKYTECVLIPGKERNTLCISTQVGCAQGCLFCCTAKGGFIRNLTTGEIVSQIRDIKKDAITKPTITNIVLMGMGEPLANYDNVVNSLLIIMDSDYGLKLSARRVTLSTCGLIPKLITLGNDIKVNLAISLNATENKTRDLLMPINKKYPIEALLNVCKNYPLAQRDKITFEYILIKGVNDSMEEAKRLVKLLTPIKAKINLIPFNEYEKSDLKRPSDLIINNFLDYLLNKNFTVILRKTKGQEISAACGQLNANSI